MAWLAQRPALVAGTVAENLNLFGELDDPLTACTQAGFDEVIAALPNGLLTVLGPGGVGCRPASVSDSGSLGCSARPRRCCFS